MQRKHQPHETRFHPHNLYHWSTRTTGKQGRYVVVRLSLLFTTFRVEIIPRLPHIKSLEYTSILVCVLLPSFLNPSKTLLKHLDMIGWVNIELSLDLASTIVTIFIAGEVIYCKTFGSSPHYLTFNT